MSARLCIRKRQQHNISASALDNMYRPSENSKWMFTFLLFHEITNVFQWHDNFGALGSLTEGIADYVMVKSGFYIRHQFTNPSAGKRWDEGYGVTERFMEYCDNNKKIHCTIE
ncbi:hypothetical protein C2S51_008963 [Perilla frutescens var. frutescens]|nr:hypothetical protein C2S51_008963 [Perilla frutescens var. frutescens]